MSLYCAQFTIKTQNTAERKKVLRKEETLIFHEKNLAWEWAGAFCLVHVLEQHLISLYIGLAN